MTKFFPPSGSSTIVRRLAILVTIVALPVLAFAGIMVLHYARATDANHQIQMQATARALSLAVDREIALQQTTAIVLSGSRPLVSGDLKAFYDRAVMMLDGDRERRVLLFSHDANLILSTQVPFGTPLPNSVFEAPIREVLRTGRPVTSDFGIGAVSRSSVLGICVPVFQDGAVRYVVTMGFSPQRISDLLLGQHLPDGWIASVMDRNGVIIGRSRASEQFVGQPASQGYLHQIAVAPDGFGQSVTDAGATVEFAHVRSALSGWTVGMAVEKTVLDAPLRAALWQIALGGLGLSLLAGGLAVAYGRTISAPISALAAAAAALGRGERPARLRLGIKEAQHVAEAIDAAAKLIEQRSAEREAVLKTLEQRVAERTRELQDSEARLRLLATTDALTGLPNRRRFDEVFATAWRQALRESTCISLLMIDADYFKCYNDYYGHEAGDTCLRAIAGAIDALLVRAGDFAARYGGEEFTVLLPNTDAEGALTVAQRIHAAICELDMPHGGSPIGSVTVSIGIATSVTQHHADPSALIRAADRNMYVAKQAGRSRIEVGQLV